MINGKRVLALIPARENSKGLPGKNTKLLCGKPLINWTIDVALSSKFVDDVVVSTDGLQIAEVSRTAGAKVPFIRPEFLARDESTSIEVALHALTELPKQGFGYFEYLILLEPTSPIRTSEDIDRMIEKLDSRSHNYDGLVSLGEVRDHPSYMKIINMDTVENLTDTFPLTTRRQDNKVVYFPYGVAYVIKVSTFFQEETFYPKNCTYYIIKPEQCYEIDTLQDFLFIETLMKNWTASE
jgi:N-acylneuraminate cytidylyltransferase/CMP-N,N'-diacetyllegionaminic acid synthase